MPETITIITVSTSRMIRNGSTKVANSVAHFADRQHGLSHIVLVDLLISPGASSSGGAPAMLAVSTRMAVTSRCSSGSGS